MKSIMIAILAGSFAATAADAASGTPQEQRACNRDAVRFCRPLLSQGDFAVLACLQQNRARLKMACKQVLANRGV
jgi:hypothetical protein